MMNTKLWLNLGLLTFVLALAGIAFYEPGKEEPKIIHVTDIDTEAATRVELTNKDAMVFEKHDGHWWLTQPFAAPANDIRIHQLLEIPRAEAEAQYPLKSSELAKFELDKPKAVLSVAGAKLMFGGSDPLDMRRYVQAGETLYMVNDDFFHHLIASPTDFVDKKLLPEEGSPNELLLPGIKAKLGADGKWTNEPATDADAGLPDLVSAWRGARAIEVKRIDKTPQGDIARISYAAGKPAVEFVIVQREPELLLARTDMGLQYLLPAESSKRLLSLQKPGATPPTGEANETEEDESAAEPMDDEEMPTEDDVDAPTDDEDQNAPNRGE